jgi:hypothetical protein
MCIRRLLWMTLSCKPYGRTSQEQAKKHGVPVQFSGSCTNLSAHGSWTHEWAVAHCVVEVSNCIPETGVICFSDDDKRISYSKYFGYKTRPPYLTCPRLEIKAGRRAPGVCLQVLWVACWIQCWLARRSCYCSEEDEQHGSRKCAMLVKKERSAERARAVDLWCAKLAVRMDGMHEEAASR